LRRRRPWLLRLQLWQGEISVIISGWFHIGK
jgi:hypothetical protein